MLGHYFSLNGQLLPIEKALIPLDNLEFSYGFGVYEALKVRNKIVYFPEKHIERLFHSAKTINLKVPLSPEAVFSALKDFTIAISEHSSYNIKIVCVTNNLYIFATAPLFVPDKLYRLGAKVITYSGERQFPQAKTLNMLMSYLAYAKAREEQAYDALLVDREGFICEGTRTNFFFTDGTTIFTPPKEKVLEGVTKLTLTEALSVKGIIVEEKTVKKDDICTNNFLNPHYQGFFLTSTSSKVLPISQIDEQVVSVPAIIQAVKEIYDQFLESYADSHWSEDNSSGKICKKNVFKSNWTASSN